MTIVNQVYKLTDTQVTYDKITIGVVVDTNDPQQMGRIRAVCLTLNDQFESTLEQIPWASYASPLGGTFNNGVRGPNDDVTTGATTYGVWGVPKVGARVLIACIDGNPLFRVWLGCLYEQFSPHTMPHGRYNHNGVDMPDGPTSSANSPIQPIYDNLTKAFGTRSHNFEWRTRGADRSVAGLSSNVMDVVSSPRPDDDQYVFVEEDGRVRTITQGYQQSSVGMGDKSTVSLFRNTKDSQIYSWTTPGFHTISMDDNSKNCRMRLRTSTGHQILLDDTNERIYISTSEGNNWIEMDQNGNIDMYSSRRLSIHAEKDINFTAGKSIRMHAAEGIHMYSGAEANIQATTSVSIKAGSTMALRSQDDIFMHSDAAVHVKAGAGLSISASGDFNFITSSVANFTSSGAMNISAGGNLLASGTQIHLNGPAAATASQATSAPDQPAKWTNKVPQHEGYARTLTADDYSHEPQFGYNDPNVGKKEGEDTIPRNPNWHR